ncbi:MAG TPA: hypothetical protein VFC71_03915 [Candidatus Polarisedimenticolia bacterium]|nr:hypothetical protein [Candidatus Polarisedimenticolia bacterium]
MGSDETVQRSPLFASAVWTPDDDEKRRAIAAAWLQEQAAYPFIRNSASWRQGWRPRHEH